jgi:DMSO/TMAO reductase YedYZ molybdopterin-dependent catalytic subunit
MKTPRLRAALAFAALALTLAGSLAAGCAPKPAASTAAAPPTVQQLEGSQIREYRGKRLDSIGDFRENSIKGPQKVDIATYRLKVDGLVDKPASYTYSQVASGFPRYSKVVRLDCVEGWSATVLWEGPLVNDIIASSTVQPAAKTVIFHARDGYTTSFPVEYFTRNKRILADRMNKVSLPMERGYPFQLVAEDKWGYKWIKWIDRIELSPDAEYRGYWEQRGYSNDGSRDKGFYGK